MSNNAKSKRGAVPVDAGMDADMGTGARYARFRLSFPDRFIARLARLSGLKAGDAVLDLGAGTGMLAVPLAGLGMTVTAMDPDAAMLAEAGAAARGAGVGITLRQGAAHDLDPGMGPFRLVTIGRAFHWMDRAATLALLDGIVAPGGAVALCHDAHPPLPENMWFRILCDQVARHAKDRDKDSGHRRYEPFLFASAFREIESLSVTIRRALTADDIIGHALTLTACAPARLGGRQQDFVAALRDALLQLAPDGRFTEVAELVAVVARRPEDTRP